VRLSLNHDNLNYSLSIDGFALDFALNS
jgi:hypothetical protein